MHVQGHRGLALDGEKSLNHGILERFMSECSLEVSHTILKTEVDQAVQEHVQVNFGNFQRGSCHNLSRHFPVFKHLFVLLLLTAQSKVYEEMC